MSSKDRYHSGRLPWPELDRPPFVTREELLLVARFALPLGVVALLLANTALVPVSFILFTVPMPLALVVAWSALVGVGVALRVQVLLKRAYRTTRPTNTPPKTPPHVNPQQRQPGL